MREASCAEERVASWGRNPFGGILTPLESTPQSGASTAGYLTQDRCGVLGVADLTLEGPGCLWEYLACGFLLFIVHITIQVLAFLKELGRPGQSWPRPLTSLRLSFPICKIWALKSSPLLISVVQQSTGCGWQPTARDPG
jgi:hypothetical protein